MGKTFSDMHAVQAVSAITVIFMLLNALLPLSPSLQAEATEYPYKLTITLKKDTYKLGETIHITWTLTNIGKETFWINLIGFHEDFVVLDENFDYVFQWNHYVFQRTLDVGWIAISHHVPIHPGENLTLTLPWRQTYEWKLPPDWDPGDPIPPPGKVPPGIYYIYGIFWIYGFPRTERGIKTPLIKVTIVGE